MLVYCKVEDCVNNKDGKCENRWEIGTEAISVEEDWYGNPVCSDYEERVETWDKK